MDTKFYYTVLDSSQDDIKEDFPNVVWKDIVYSQNSGTKMTGDYVANATIYSDDVVTTAGKDLATAFEERVYELMAALNSLTTNTFTQLTGKTDYVVEG